MNFPSFPALIAVKTKLTKVLSMFFREYVLKWALVCLYLLVIGAGSILSKLERLSQEVMQVGLLQMYQSRTNRLLMYLKPRLETLKSLVLALAKKERIGLFISTLRQKLKVGRARIFGVIK